MSAPQQGRTIEDKYRWSKTANFVLAGIVVFLSVVLAAQLTSGSAPGATSTSTATVARDELAVVRRDADDPTGVGKTDAPVVLVQWTDFRCPYCGVFSRDTLPTLMKEYVDTGKVRIEINAVNFFGEQSEDAAVAALAAGQQAKYFEYANAVFDAAPERGHANLTKATLIGFAEKVGVADLDKFTTDLARDDLRTQVKQATSAAQSLGVTVVPFFAVGKQSLSGAQPIDTFRKYLDAAIAKAE